MNSANLEAQLVGKGATIKLREALAAKERPSEFRPCPDCSGPLTSDGLHTLARDACHPPRDFMPARHGVIAAGIQGL